MSTGGVASQSSSVQIVKLLLIGNSGVGKSSILLRFVEDKFLPSDMQATTIGVDYKYKIIEKDGQKIKLAIWVSILCCLLICRILRDKTSFELLLHRTIEALMVSFWVIYL